MTNHHHILVVFSLIVLLFAPAFAGAQDSPPPPAPSRPGEEVYRLDFVATQNFPGAVGQMKIAVWTGQTRVSFWVAKASPNTVYTIWTVFNILRWPLPTTGFEVPSYPASDRPGFPREGNGVSPLARLDAAFTSGMGLDTGATFVTDANGNGYVELVVDYDLVRAAPISNRDMSTQCPGVDSGINCPTIRITTTWLRTFIGEYPLPERGLLCANYDPGADADLVPDVLDRRGMDSRYWQCVDPASVDATTGRFVIRVPRFEFDHFRLANHPDGLTHGFIGGNSIDHRIDMVGRRIDMIRAW